MVHKFRDMFATKIRDLKNLMNPSELALELRRVNVITKPQFENITQIMLTRGDQAQRLIDALELRPDADWPKFVRALVETNETQIIELLGIEIAASDAESVAVSMQPQSCGGQSIAQPGENDEGPDVSVVKVKPTTQDFYEEHCYGAYAMHRKPRGIACIINIRHNVGLTERIGTDVDRDNLEKLFNQLHFDVKPFIFNDLSAKEILDKVASTADERVNGSRPQCYVLFILSHGGTNATEGEFLVGSDGVSLGKTEVLKTLNRPNLKDTPRLVCFVSCRGEKQLKVDEADAVHLPGDHFIVGFPCQEDYVSLRHPALGTRYVRCLVKLFMERAHDTDVKTLLESATMDGELEKLVDKGGLHQISGCEQTLKKDLFFFPGYSE